LLRNWQLFFCTCSLFLAVTFFAGIKGDIADILENSKSSDEAIPFTEIVEKSDDI
jgi:hypothetical protein